MRTVARFRREEAEMSTKRTKVNKLFSVVAAAGVLAGCVVAVPSAAAAPAAPDFQPAPITWGACSSPSLQKAGAQCGFLEVPMDYTNPGGAKVSVAVSRVQHKTAESQGVMVVNPGGPGG